MTIEKEERVSLMCLFRDLMSLNISGNNSK